MKLTLNEQIEKIQENYLEVGEISTNLFEIPLFPKMNLQVNLKKYPKKIKFIIPKQIKKILGVLETYLPAYQNWNKNEPPIISSLINSLKWTLETITGINIHFSDKIFKDLCYMGKSSHPNEIFCVLRIKDGVLSEYILAPQMVASETTAVFYPHRLARDRSICASFHTHPSGNYHPSLADLKTFRQKPVNIILGRPYNVSSIGVYNAIGENCEFEINDSSDEI